jgi:hypothetical protein
MMDAFLTPRARALRCLHILLDAAAKRLSEAQKEYRYCKTRCDLAGLLRAQAEGEKAFRDCGKRSNDLRRLR